MLGEGQVLDHTYRIVRLIGEGGMGVVYEATHARLAGRYAIKVLLQNLSENVQALERFNREARITSSLQHPNIVQVVDFNKDADGTEYLVMEYLQGETLAERLYRAGALPTGSVLEIVDQAAAALAAAHAHGIIHRDLKPDNMFLVPIEGRHGELVKVLDFGISKARDLSRGLQGPVSALMGTPRYMSPEQCRCIEDVDAATDQFALAVITYEMLTGRAPFQADSIGALLSQVLYDEAPAMDIDPAVEKVVRRGLAKSGRDRFPSVTAFAEALRAAVFEGDPLVTGNLGAAASGLPAESSQVLGHLRPGIRRRAVPGRGQQPVRRGVTVGVAAIAIGLLTILWPSREKPAPLLQVGSLAASAEGAGPHRPEYRAPPPLPSATATTLATLEPSSPATVSRRARSGRLPAEQNGTSVKANGGDFAASDSTDPVDHSHARERRAATPDPLVPRRGAVTSRAELPRSSPAPEQPLRVGAPDVDGDAILPLGELPGGDNTLPPTPEPSLP